MRHKGVLIALIAVLILFGGAFLFGMFAYLLLGGDAADTWSVGSAVGVVTVDGPIVSADKTVKELDKFRKEDHIKAIVLRIESPGGSVAASQEILEAVKNLKKVKPVVASMGSVAASGGYYIACGASKILANPGTITGSIGVRMEHVMIGDLLKWAMIHHETLKSGRFKDLAAYDRPMTPQEREILQRVLDDIHRQFKEEVAGSRGLDVAAVDQIADGRVYTGHQAFALKLVDEMGGFSDAVKQAAAMGGIKGEPKVIYLKKRFYGIDQLFESLSQRLGLNSVLSRVDWWQPLLFVGSLKPE